MVKLFQQPPPHLEPAAAVVCAPLAVAPTAEGCWQDELPILTGSLVTLRELETSDAPALYCALSNDTVTRFLTPPPATVEGFEAFIECARRQRQAGQYACFAVVPHGTGTPVGVLQVRALDPAFNTAEWGFALAPEFWGKGLFEESASLLIHFVFHVIGAHRIEARAVMRNGRANGALKKVGAVMEGVLRRSFLRRGEYLDQALWTIVRDEWLGTDCTARGQVTFH